MPSNNERINGAVFMNNRPNGPLYSGKITIDGTDHYVSFWEKTSKKGTQYLAVSEDKYAANKAAGQPPQTKFFAPPPRPAPAPKPNDMDDDIPF